MQKDRYQQGYNQGKNLLICYSKNSGNSPTEYYCNADYFTLTYSGYVATATLLQNVDSIGVVTVGGGSNDSQGCAFYKDSTKIKDIGGATCALANFTYTSVTSGTLFKINPRQTGGIGVMTIWRNN